MSIQRLRTATIGTAVAALGLIAAAGSAQAAVYAGSWDPNYGGIFSNLGWRATASFDVPEACLNQADNNYTPTGNCSGFSVLSATLEFYDVAAPATTLETFNLDTSVVVNGLDIAHGDLVGIDTGYFAPAIPTKAAAKAIAGKGDYGFSLLLYNDTFAQLAYAKPNTISPASCSFTAGSDCGFSSDASQGTITPVPEPETYALMLAGMGAIGWVARRRQRQAEQA